VTPPAAYVARPGAVAAPGHTLAAQELADLPGAVRLTTARAHVQEARVRTPGFPARTVRVLTAGPSGTPGGRVPVATACTCPVAQGGRGCLHALAAGITLIRTTAHHHGGPPA
jgi:hypothetical protein